MKILVNDPTKRSPMVNEQFHLIECLSGISMTSVTTPKGPVTPTDLRMRKLKKNMSPREQKPCLSKPGRGRLEWWAKTQILGTENVPPREFVVRVIDTSFPFIVRAFGDSLPKRFRMPRKITYK